MDDNVKDLPVKFRKPPASDDTFFVISTSMCLHGQYEVDKDLLEVICTKCKEKLNPMNVLIHLAYEETRWHRAREAYKNERAVLADRKRTTCQHCGRMTRIKGL